METPLRYFAAAGVMKILWVSFHSTSSLHELQQVLDGGDVRVSQLQAQLWAWVVGVLVSPSH